MSASALLSIVIPSYNCGHLLQRSVRSAFALGTDLVEVVVVDDGSTDETPAVCDRLCEQYPSVKIIRQVNGGLSAARNTGIRNSSGSYLLLLDADDELLSFDPGVVQSADVDVLRIGVEDVAVDGTVHHQQQMVSHRPGPAYLQECLSGHGGRDWRVESWAYIYRRSFLEQEQLEFPEGLLHEDTRFTIEALLKASSVAATNVLVYRYIRRASSIMGTHSYAMSRRRIECFTAIQRDIVAWANAHPEVDLWLWAEHLVNVAWRYACIEQSRRLALAVLRMEWELFFGYRLWGLYRTRQQARYRLRRGLEQVLWGPAERPTPSNARPAHG